jgi:hypothetical protein
MSCGCSRSAPLPKLTEQVGSFPTGSHHKQSNREPPQTSQSGASAIGRTHKKSDGATSQLPSDGSG